MIFRSNEATKNGREKALQYLVPKNAVGKERKQMQDTVQDIVDRYGPVVDGYPSWHPIIRKYDDQVPITVPNSESGYDGLDHTIYLANGFITCPYNDNQKVIKSVENLPYDTPSCDLARIEAEPIDLQLYHEGTAPVLVTCSWERDLLSDGTIPLSLAAPLILESEVKCWRWAKRAETWETMRPYFLGTPCGKRSSLFINQETGQKLKSLWNTMINTGMFGPIKD